MCVCVYVWCLCVCVCVCVCVFFISKGCFRFLFMFQRTVETEVVLQSSNFEASKLFKIEPFSTLRKHAYSNILNILPPQNEYFQMKNSDNFHISAQNIDWGYSLEPPRQGGCNEYPQSMFLSRNKNK